MDDYAAVLFNNSARARTVAWRNAATAYRVTAEDARITKTTLVAEAIV